MMQGENEYGPVKIMIQGLYKIFGADAKSMVPLVQQGMDKQTLLDRHGHVLGLKDINLKLHERNIEVIMGLSGSGKSTLIRHINRLLEPTDGQVRIDGDDVLTYNVKQLRQLRLNKVSMVFQRFALLPHRTVLENVLFGLELRGGDNADRDKKARYWLDRVGLGGFENNYPKQLSGGMQQRVGLARALATDADILLMDEAFSALDPLIRTEMQDMLLGLQSEFNKTIVFITHDLDEALKLGDRIAILRDGEVVQQGDIQDILLRPVDDYVRRFVADVNRAKVLRVRSIMTRLDGSADGPAAGDNPLMVKAQNCVEDVLNAVVLKSPSSIWVQDDDGERVGYIERDKLAETIGRDALA